MAARRERGLLDPNAAAGRLAVRPPHLRAVLRRRHRGGRVSAEASVDRRRPAARQPHPDLRRQPDLDRGRHRHRAHRGRRRSATRPTAGTSSTSTGPTAARRTRRTSPRCTTRSARPRRSPTSPASSCCTRSSPGRRPNAQNTGKAHGSALGDDEVAATKKVLGFDPDADLRGPAGRPRAHPPGRRARQGRAGRVGRRVRRVGAQAVRRRRPSSSGCRRAPCPTAGPTTCRRSTADEKGMATRKASGAVINAIAERVPELWGGSADLAESNNTTIEGAPSFLPERPRHQDVEGRPARRPGAALRHPRARHGRDHERHRRPRRHPRLRRHVPHVLRLHARRRSGWPR